MEKYVTPIKENYYPSSKTTAQRQGDWICSSCNNLNFSFRKKCNRCKIQTKQQNNLTPVYSYYYYLQPNNTHVRQPLLDYRLLHQGNIQTPPTQKSKIKPQLPSVSPLIKKYNNSKIKERFTAQSQNNSILDLTQRCENIWQCIDFMDMENPRKGNQKGQDDELQINEQLEKIIGRIIL